MAAEMVDLISAAESRSCPFSLSPQKKKQLFPTSSQHHRPAVTETARPDAAPRVEKIRSKNPNEKIS
jgi:hypothetical protein